MTLRLDGKLVTYVEDIYCTAHECVYTHDFHYIIFSSCSVISVLSEYGTKFPQEIQTELRANIILPDEKRVATIGFAELPSPVDENFNPQPTPAF